MKTLYQKIQSCRLCSCPVTGAALDLGMQALTGVFPRSEEEDVPQGPLQVVVCSGCGLVQLAHNYDPSKLYGDTYGYRSGLNVSMVRHLTEIAVDIERRMALAVDDIVLDIGSNDGTLLRGYSNPGLRLVGIDPSAEKLRRFYRPGVDLVPDFFSAEGFVNVTGGQRAKVITSIAMFYDLAEPLKFAAEVRDILDEDGIWVFEQSYLPSMLAAGAYDTICHEHLEYYAMAQIVYIAKQSGLKIIDVETNDVNGGSFRVTVSHQDSLFPEANGRVSELLRHEENRSIGTVGPLEQLGERMANHRREILVLLRALKERGKRVIGYGASTKGNVMLQYCGIDRDLLPSIAEISEDKFGCVTPGTQIPIIPEAEARAAGPDYFLVLPWHFRNGIVERESRFLGDGGRLIFPLPQVEVVSESVQATA